MADLPDLPDLPEEFLNRHALDILQALPGPMVVVDGTGQILYFNHAAENLTGFAASEMVGANVSQLIPTSTRQRIDVVDWLVRWSKNPDQAQLHHLHLTGITQHGEPIPYGVRVASFSSEGQAYYVILFRDISDELQSQTDLKNNSLLAGRILAISEDAILTLDDDFHIQFWNHKAEAIFGYPAEEMIGQHVNQLIPDHLRAAHDEQIGTFKQGTQPTRLMGDRGEISGLHKDGRVLSLEASITKTRIEGQVVLSAHIRDVTRRKLAEKALLDSELRFRAIFDGAVEFMLLLDTRGTVVELNKAATTILGDRAANIGKACWLLDWWPDRTEDATRSLRKTLQKEVQRAATGERLRTELALDETTGEQRQIDFSLIPIQNSSGKVALIIAEGRNISALQEYLAGG